MENRLGFANYTGNLVTSRLGDLCERIMRKNSENQSDLPLTISSIDGLVDQRDYFNKVVAAKDMSGYYLLKRGEFAYNKSYSVGYDYGTIKRLNKYDEGCLSTLYICFAIKSNAIDSNYLECFFDSLVWYKDMANVCTEGARNHGLLNVDIEEFFNIKVVYPADIEEQKKTAKILNNLDEKIKAEKTNVEKLKALKSSMLTKMFPKEGESVPELRFKGFTDPWEQCKLSEVASMHARIGWQNLRTSEFLDKGDYMLITGTDFVDGSIDYSTCHYVARERYEQDRNIQISNGSILITKDGTLGKVAYVQGLSVPATLNAGVFNLEIRNVDMIDEKYLFQYLKAPFLMDYVDMKSTGGTIKHLNQNILIDFPVIYPTKEEQVLIGDYFQGIDNLITLHQRKYEKLLDVKKAFLEKMIGGDN